MYYVALPGMILWGIGIPLFAIILLYLNKKKLDEERTLQKFGFLFKGFKKRYYYWEGLITYRKIMMIFIQVFLVRFGVAMAVLIILILFISLSLSYKPFQTLTLNKIETLSLITSMVTIYCGIFFILDVNNTNVSSSNTETQSQTAVYLNENIKMFFFCCIVLSNVIFFTTWGIMMMIEIRSMMIKKAGVIYMFCCLCGNRKALGALQQKEIDKEEHEILREGFTDLLRTLKEKVNNEDILLNKERLEKLQKYLGKQQVLDYLEIGDKYDLLRKEQEKHKKRLKDLEVKNFLVGHSLMDKGDLPKTRNAKSYQKQLDDLKKSKTMGKLAKIHPGETPRSMTSRSNKSKDPTPRGVEEQTPRSTVRTLKIDDIYIGGLDVINETKKEDSLIYKDYGNLGQISHSQSSGRSYKNKFKFGDDVVESDNLESRIQPTKEGTSREDIDVTKSAPLVEVKSKFSLNLGLLKRTKKNQITPSGYMLSQGQTQSNKYSTEELVILEEQKDDLIESEKLEKVEVSLNSQDESDQVEVQEDQEESKGSQTHTFSASERGIDSSSDQIPPLKHAKETKLFNSKTIMSRAIDSLKSSMISQALSRISKKDSSLIQKQGQRSQVESKVSMRQSIQQMGVYQSIVDESNSSRQVPNQVTWEDPSQTSEGMPTQEIKLKKGGRRPSKSSLKKSSKTNQRYQLQQESDRTLEEVKSGEIHASFNKAESLDTQTQVLDTLEVQEINDEEKLFQNQNEEVKLKVKKRGKKLDDTLVGDLIFKKRNKDQ